MIMILRFFLIICAVINGITCPEPITVGIGVAVALAGSLFMPRCHYQECCNEASKSLLSDTWIYYDDDHLNQLKKDLVQKLHGQPLVRELVYKAIAKHVKDADPVKPLVLSFHGWVGSGKNFASSIIAKNLYKLGLDSAFVHMISGTDKYIDPSKVDTYKIEINNYLKEHLSKCGRQLFIIDEVDKMPPGIMDAFLPFFEYSKNVKGANKAIFLILSNTGGSAIARIARDFYQQGKSRKDISLKDIESSINLSAFNEKGGLWKSHLIDSHLIDFYIPFLPLERQHVRLCIVDYLREKYNITKAVDDSFVVEVSDEMDYYPPDLKIYSTSGCKRIAKKVDIMLD